jgi:hypothetical protein
MSTLANFNLSITAPKGVIPDLAVVGKTPLWLQQVGNFFEACAGGMAPGQQGETRISVHKGSTAAAALSAYQKIAFASVAADTVIEVNGVPFSAVAGAATAGNNEFDQSGSDTADMTAFIAAVVASTTAGVAGDVTGCNLVGTATLANVTAGQKLVLDGQPLKATSYATGRQAEFDISGNDTADATALVNCINNHNVLRHKFFAESAAGVVTIRQKTGTVGATLTTEAATITLGGLSSGKLAASSTGLLVARGRGTLGNGVRVVTKGLVASDTITYVTPSGAQTVTVNGVQVYNATAGATAALTAAAVAAAINASTNTAVAGQVRAVARAGVVKVFSVLPGLIGNGMTLSATGTGATVATARLAGGTEASSGGAQATQTFTITSGSGTETATINGVAVAITWATSDNNSATLLANAINANTSLQGLVYAVAAANVVTVTAVKGGLAGNNVTTTATGTGNVAGGTTLTGGAAPTTVVTGADYFTGGVGGDDTAPVAYQF